jgi:UDP-N-acetylmuramoyl-L-alanyl-D-glutamate--2,6-diaminopimelate ligase
MTSQQKHFETSLTLSAVSKILAEANELVSSRDDSKALNQPVYTAIDSRKVKKDSIFIAYKGVNSDGHSHLASAIAAGAAGLVVEDQSLIPADCKVPVWQVKSGRAAWAWLAAASCGNPQNKLLAAAVTGTNGKTSTVWMLRSILEQMNHKVVCLGTLGAWVCGEFVKTSHTTPDPDDLFLLLREAVAKGATHLVMEASSQALLHARLDPIKPVAVGFTSFSRDHLDLHGTMENYLAAKMRLFCELSRADSRAVFHRLLDTRVNQELIKASDRWTYSASPSAQFDLVSTKTTWVKSSHLHLQLISSSSKGTFVRVIDAQGVREGNLPYFGQFLLENFCAALLLAEKLLGKKVPSGIWQHLTPVPGRLEPVTSGELGPTVIVDYAHTPDALEKALQALRPLCKGNLTVVFGCGGDRDKGKRPLMAKAASEHADRIVVTSDNPRSEAPEAIIADIAAGIQKGKKAVTIIDRRQAILHAIKNAGEEDLVLIAGKGHEDYQIIGSERFYFDDRVVAKSILSGAKP